MNANREKLSMRRMILKRVFFSGRDFKAVRRDSVKFVQSKNLACFTSSGLALQKNDNNTVSSRKIGSAMR